MRKNHKMGTMRGAQVRALSIFMRMKRVEQEVLSKISPELQMKLDDLFDGLKKEKKLDPETVEQLKIYLKKKNEVEGAREILKDITDYIVNKLHDYEQDRLGKILLHLTPDGELYKDSEDRHCYPMTKSALRLKIIRLLIGRESFTPRKYVAKHIGTTEGSTAFAKSKINSISKRLLDLPEDEPLIISKDHGGYKLNPLYRIISKWP